MTEALALQILGYVVTYGPTAEQVIMGLIKGVQTLQAGGATVTDDQLRAMALGLLAAHNALPVPKA